MLYPCCCRNLLVGSAEWRKNKSWSWDKRNTVAYSMVVSGWYDIVDLKVVGVGAGRSLIHPYPLCCLETNKWKRHSFRTFRGLGLFEERGCVCILSDGDSFNFLISYGDLFPFVFSVFLFFIYSGRWKHLTQREETKEENMHRQFQLNIHYYMYMQKCAIYTYLLINIYIFTHKTHTCIYTYIYR